MNSSPVSTARIAEIILFSRRMGNYLYLPLFVVFVFCSIVILGTQFSDPGSGPVVSERAAAFFHSGTVVGFVLWRMSRRPKRALLLAQGLILALLTIMWVFWVPYVILVEREWHRLFQLAWALVVGFGMGGASQSCFRAWRDLRSVEASEIDRALLDLATVQTSAVTEAEADNEVNGEKPS